MMGKEVIIAIFGGLTIGLIIAFGAWRINASKPATNSITQNSIQSSTTPEPTPADSRLSLTGIENGSIFNESPVTIKGFTSPDNIVVVSSESEDFVLAPNGNSTFEQEIKLTKGINTITVVSISTKENKNQESTYTSFFYPDFLLDSTSETLDKNATKEADSVLERVKEKVDALKKNPKVYIGTITDKTDTSIQIKSDLGKIELVSVTDLTKYSRIDKTETEIKFSDIAIGDTISALGTLGSSEVLNAKNIILSTSPIASRKVLVGTVKSIVKKQITIDSATESQTITFGAKWKGPEIKTITEGSSVIVISVATDGKPIIRTIEIVKAANLTIENGN